MSHAKVEEVLIMKETWWKSNLNFVKCVPMIHVNFIVIVIVIIVSEKEIGFTFILT